MMKLYILFYFIGVIHVARALTEEELKKNMVKHVMKCMKTNPVPVLEVIEMQKMIVPTNPETKCLLACAYKSDGIMTKDGKYDLEYSYKVAEKMKNGDEKRKENAMKLADICAKVNEVQVTDGEKGCERAALMFKCTVENAPKFGFKV